MATRRKKKKSHRLYALVVILLGIAIIVGTFLLLFYVQKIEIKGNEYTEDAVIAEYVQEDRLSANSLYLLIKYRFLDQDIPGSLSSMKVSLKNPWTVKITVKEKPIIGYFCENDGYAFFDKDGTVVAKGKEIKADVPCIEGLDISKTKLYQPLKVESKKLLKAILNVAQEVKDYELNPDRIVCTDEGIELYFGNIRVMLGNEVTTEKMAQITPIIAKLGDKAGTLHLEHFKSESNTITFTEDVPEDTAEAEASESYDAGEEFGEVYSSEDYTEEDYSEESYELYE